MPEMDLVILASALVFARQAIVLFYKAVGFFCPLLVTSLEGLNQECLGYYPQKRKDFRRAKIIEELAF